jgi:hypothetical protein
MLDESEDVEDQRFAPADEMAERALARGAGEDQAIVHDHEVFEDRVGAARAEIEKAIQDRRMLRRRVQP